MLRECDKMREAPSFGDFLTVQHTFFRALRVLWTARARLWGQHSTPIPIGRGGSFLKQVRHR